MPFLIAGTYLSVALCWLLTVLLLRRRGGGLAHGDRSYRILLSILLIDGVRTFAEQAYFGIGHTLEHASPDPTVLMYLHSPLMILFPKLSLLICSLVVLYLVAFRWSPSTEQKRLLEAMNTVRQAEQLRQTQADLMQTIFDQMDQGVMAVEADGTVSAFNQRLLALLELPALLVVLAVLLLLY